MTWTTIILMIVVVILILIALGFVIFRINQKSLQIAGTNPQSVDTQGRYPWEFWLVVVMLVALLSLIMAILLPPVPPPEISQMPESARANIAFQNLHEYNKMQLENRKDILAIIITAFGAWVGAGAAYFFGRENLRVATEGLLTMRGVSPKELLRRTSIKQISKPLDWIVPIDTPVDDVKAKLMSEPARWFIPIVKADGTLKTVINEEVVYRFLLNNIYSPPVVGGTVEAMLAYIDSQPELIRFRQIYVAVTMDATVGAANELMDSKEVFLAIVETDGKPTHFFTTAEVRKLLLQGG